MDVVLGASLVLAGACLAIVALVKSAELTRARSTVTTRALVSLIFGILCGAMLVVHGLTVAVDTAHATDATQRPLFGSVIQLGTQAVLNTAMAVLVMPSTFLVLYQIILATLAVTTVGAFVAAPLLLAVTLPLVFLVTILAMRHVKAIDPRNAWAYPNPDYDPKATLSGTSRAGLVFLFIESLLLSAHHVTCNAAIVNASLLLFAVTHSAVLYATLGSVPKVAVR